MFKTVDQKITAIGFLVLLIISGLLVSIWFRSNLLFAGGEDQLPFYNIPRAFELFSSTWQKIGTGFPQVFNLSKIGSVSVLNLLWQFGIRDSLLQRGVFLTLLITGSFSCFLLFKQEIANKLTPFRSLLLSLFCGILYIFNPFSLGQVWGRGLYFQFFFFALLPLTVYLFINWLRTGSGKYLSIFILMNWVLSWSYGHPAHFVTLAVVQVATFLAVSPKKTLARFAIWFAVWLLINSYWLLPFILFGQKLFVGVSDPQNNIEIFKSLSSQSSFIWIIRLMSKNLFETNMTYGSIYTMPLFKLLTFLLPFLAFMGQFKLKNMPFRLFIIIALILGIAVSLGSNSPIGFAFSEAMNAIPQLQVYRNSYEKFGFVLMLSLSMLAPTAFITIHNTKKLVVLSLLSLVICCGVVVWPLWTTHFAGGSKFNAWIKVPSDYQAIDTWLQTQPGDFKLLQVPLLPGDGVKYTWEHPYQGIEASEYLFTNPSIGRDLVINQDTYTALLDRFGKTSAGATLPGRGQNNQNFKRKSLSEELKILGVKYIILHKDIDTNFSGASSVEFTKKVIETDPTIKQEKETTNLIVYHVTPTENTNLLVHNLESTELLWLYHPLWTLEMSGTKYPPTRSHDFSNLWNKSTSNLTYSIYFKPQKLVNFWLVVSLVSSLLIIVYFLTKPVISFLNSVLLSSKLWLVRRNK